MKHVLSSLLILALLLCTPAYAETCRIQRGVDMENNLTDCTLYVGFTLDDVSDTTVSAMVYDDVSYDLVDVHNLAVGDTLETAQGDITVASKEQDESGYIQINGGAKDLSSVVVSMISGHLCTAANGKQKHVSVCSECVFKSVAGRQNSLPVNICRSLSAAAALLLQYFVKPSGRDFISYLFKFHCNLQVCVSEHHS